MTTKRIKQIVYLLFPLVFLANKIQAQSYQPTIISAKIVKTDPRLITISGYLVVPENRKKPGANAIQIPFVFVRRAEQDARKNISLYTTGGPGYSTIANIDSIGYNSGFLKYGGFIAFDQRGTKRTVPSLACNEVDEAIRRSYREGKNRDSLVQLAIIACRNRLTAQGIDLSNYTSLASAADINDLRLALQLDSLNLVGVSYSGGLMLNVAKLYPEAVKILILNSPLPSNVNYEEQGLYNINEALEQVFKNCAADSSVLYKDIRNQFHAYFSQITNKRFHMNYLEKPNQVGVDITYGKSELLAIIVDQLNSAMVKHVPHTIMELIKGNHQKHVAQLLDGYFSGNPSVSLGMRYAIYCSEQIAYADEKKQFKSEEKLPWLQGYRFNNVDQAICACWDVPAEHSSAKQPTISKIPALIVSGNIDPWTRPYYHRIIKKTMPNAQLMIRHNQGHAPGYRVEGKDYLESFMANPFQKLKSSSNELTIE